MKEVFTLYDVSSNEVVEALKGHESDAGYDLSYKCQAVTVKKHSTVKLPTGLKVVIKDGFFLSVVPRSSLAIQGINVVGTIDQDYKDEIFVIFQNNSSKDIKINNGDRIAQMYPQKRYKSTNERYLKDTRSNGFGSTGK